MKKFILILMFGFMVGSAFADLFLAYDGKTGSMPEIALRKSYAENEAAMMRDSFGVYGDNVKILKGSSNQWDYVISADPNLGVLPPVTAPLGKGKEQFKKQYDPNNVTEFVKVF